MFGITRASGMQLFKAYQKQGKITCIKGKDENPISFYTANIAFVGDGTKFICKAKYNADKHSIGRLEKYIRSTMPNAFTA